MTAEDTPTEATPTEITHSDQFSHGRIHLSELTGLEIRDCEVSGLRLVDCYGDEVRVNGGFDRVIVNDVDVTDHVEAELDRRHPTRALARESSTPDQHRAAWQAIETAWRATIDRARRLPEEKLHQRVDGEWSFVETLRHLLFASDAWLGSAVLEEKSPHHPWGIPAGGTPAEDAASVGLALDATPSLADVLAAREARLATFRQTLIDLTDEGYDRVCGKPAHFYPDQDYVVGRCLRVVLNEEAGHHRYAVRDLAVLEA